MSEQRFFRPRRLDTLKDEAFPLVHRMVKVESWHENITMRDRYPNDQYIGHVASVALDFPECELLVKQPAEWWYDYEQVPLMLACNHSDTGRFEGLLRMLHIDDNLELESDIMGDDAPKIAQDLKRKELVIGESRINQFRCPYLKWNPHVGNWCWDKVVIYGKDLLPLLTYLRDVEKMDCVTAEERFFLMRIGRVGSLVTSLFGFC